MWGWMIYTILIGSFFAFIKSINYRLHKLFGTDPLILKKEEAAKTEDAVKEEADNERTEDDNDDKLTAPEFIVEPYPARKDESEVDVNVEMHKSASSLNSTTDRTSMDTMELSRRSSGSHRTSRRSSPKLDITVATSAGAVGVAVTEVIHKVLEFKQ